MSYLEYDDSSIGSIKDNKVGASLLDKLTRIKSVRREKPLDQFDNIPYPHRQLYDGYNLLIGDTYFLIPPEFIMVTSESTSESIITIRQENTQKQKNGYHKRSVMIDLVFHGYEQINGFKVDGPEAPSKYYYVDGLRPLLAQFKCTPFLPITNELINNTYGIYNVALQAITIQTVEGYPDLLKAHLTLQEVNMFPYIEMPDICFRYMIDWDLFRFYYQSFLSEKNEYKRLKSIPANKELTHFRMSILDDNIFNIINPETGKTDTSKTKINEYNILEVVTDKKILRKDSGGNLLDTNYITWIDSSESDVVISSFQCGYSNLLTNIQMSDMSTPTLQFLGGMDTIYNITFETKDKSIVAAIESCQIENDKLLRNNTKLRASMGFIKLESELVAFTGSLFVMIDSVATNTVPGFPGLYNVQISCVAYDIAQSEREDLHGFRPFECNHNDCNNNSFDPKHVHKEQAIDQTEEGLLNKIKQDNYAEWKLRSSIEVYPDLRLPKYKKVNKIIDKIIKFRAKNGLSELPYNIYPTQPTVMLHGNNPNKDNIKINSFVKDSSNSIVDIKSLDKTALEYDVYVDPDFYVFYPFSYASFMQEVDENIYDEIMMPPQFEGYTKRHTEFGFPSYTEEDAESSEDADTVGSASADAFVELARSKMDPNGYVWGACGPTKFDCSGLVWYCLKKVGALPENCERLTTSSIRECAKKGKYFKRVEWNEKQRGDLIMPAHRHVTIYQGNGMIVHAASTASGIKEQSVDSYNFQSEHKDSKGNVLYTGRLVLRPKAFINETKAITKATATTTKSKQKVMAQVWGLLKKNGFTDIAAAGIMGNIEEESRFNPSLLEAGSHADSKYNSASYTKAIDNGKYSKDSFMHDASGYGLFQFTYKTKKADLYKAAKENNVSISDIELQIIVMDKQLGGLKKQLNKAASIEQATFMFLDKYENPADKGPKEQAQRNAAAKIAYNMFAGTSGSAVETTGISTDTNTNTDAKIRIITREQFESICRTVMCNTEGENSDSEKAFAQLIYDRITDEKKRFGNIKHIISSLTDGIDINFELNDTVEDNVKAVFVKNEKVWKKHQAMWFLTADDPKIDIKEYNKRHEKLKSVGNHMYWGNNKNSSDIVFNIQGEDGIIQEGTAVTSEGSITISEHEVSHDEMKIKDPELFAEPVIIKTDYYKKRTQSHGVKYKNMVNSSDNAFNTSFCDMYQYSARGRLVRAFPTYLFCILDDNAQWFDGRKLWTNYYTHRSVVNINVHATNDMPTETATITINNSYHNLDRYQGGLSDTYKISEDKANSLLNKIPFFGNFIPSSTGYNDFQRWFYDVSGGMLLSFGPKLTDKLIKLHQVICSHAMLREGTRVHLRMGYGSDPLALAPVINGHVSDVSLGDQIQIVVTSDGHEMIQNIVSAKEKASNNGWLGLFGLGEKQESSNIIATVMCKRSSWVTYLAKGSFEMSVHSIEHFGLFMHQSATGTAGASAVGGSIGAAAGTAVAPIVGTAIGAVAGSAIGAITGSIITTFAGGIGTNNNVNIADLWDEWAEQYDILKNVYRASYKKILYHYDDSYATLGDDGENNIVFRSYNMTPWDVCQICTQQVPEYILKLSYHQFDSRIYFGLPFWMEKFRYDYIGGEVYEECKTASQVHFLDSMDTIIDNQVRVTSKYSSTNMKVMYIRGSNAVSTQTIHSDDTIDMSKQKTTIMDTPIVQDGLGPDALWELFGCYKVGSESARRVGISNLLYGWQQQYQGQLLCLGTPGIKPNDYIMINDTFANMIGVAVVREVVYSFGVDTGFTTSITPGLVGFSSDGNSGMIERVQTYVGVLATFSCYTSVRRTIKNNYEANIGLWGNMEALKQQIAVSYEAAGTPFIADALDEASSLYVAYACTRAGYNIVKAVMCLSKSEKFKTVAKDLPALAKTVWNFVSSAAKYKTISNTVKAVGLANSIKSVLAGISIAAAPETGGLSVVVFTVANILFSILVETIFHSIRLYFDNKNVCVLLPLYWENYPFVAGVKDGEKILLIPANSPTDENEAKDRIEVENN